MGRLLAFPVMLLSPFGCDCPDSVMDSQLFSWTQSFWSVNPLVGSFFAAFVLSFAWGRWDRLLGLYNQGIRTVFLSVCCFSAYAFCVVRSQGLCPAAQSLFIHCIAHCHLALSSRWLVQFPVCLMRSSCFDSYKRFESSHYSSGNSISYNIQIHSVRWHFQ